MIRGAILTLGTVVALGCIGAARGEGLSLWDWPSLLPSLPSLAGVFPRLPENWSDLPLQLHLSETLGYNSNITGAATGPGVDELTSGRPIGAWESISNYGASFKNQLGGQQFFADASWGMYRYLNNGRFNTPQHSVDVGDNFTYGSKCKGTLRASDVSAPSAPGSQVATNVVNSVTTASVTEEAKCLINGEFSGIFNSGRTSVTNTSLADKPNNYQSIFVAAGIAYAVTDTNSLQVLATLTGYDYTDRPNGAQAGLVNKLTTEEVMATYIKNFGPNLSINAGIGLIGVNNSYFSLGSPQSILPEYSFTLKWSATPKLTLNAAASRLEYPATSIIANLQSTDAASVGFTYNWTPKITLSGALQASYATGTAGTNMFLGRTNQFISNQKTYGATASLAYAITPFLGANLSYQCYKQLQYNTTTNGSLILLALNFNPY